MRAHDKDYRARPLWLVAFGLATGSQEVLEAPHPNPAGRAHGRDFREGCRLPVACARNHERHAAVPGSGKQSGNTRAGHCRRSTRGPRY